MIKKILSLANKQLKSLTRSATGKTAKKTRSSAEQPLKSAAEQATAKAASSPAVPAAAAEETAAPAERPAKFRQPSRKKKPQAAAWDPASFEVTPVPGKSRFHDFTLPKRIMHAIADLEFQYCTPIQEKSLPTTLKGQDMVGKANTGTGKSAVFLITILTRLLAQEKETPPAPPFKPRALVIAPTRELVIQIAKDGRKLAKYTPLNILAVYGGVDYQKQLDEAREGKSDIIVATPGRLLDFVSKKVIKLDRCEIMVIDEADRMLDMGFIPDVRRIIGRIRDKEQRQTMLFSATITEDVKRLAFQWCRKPEFIDIPSEQLAVETVEQIVYLVTTDEKYTVLYNLISSKPDQRIIVFTNQKHEARTLSQNLQDHNIRCSLLSGDVPQNKRVQRLEGFRSGKVKVLIATDVAARGIHIEGISHVVNFTLPYEPENYVHRIGRTGRAGALGTSISFACEEDAFYLPEIEEYIEKKLDCVVPEEELLTPPPPKRKSKPKQQSRQQGNQQDRDKKRAPRRRRRRKPGGGGSRPGSSSGTE
ncbi:DEAD/DEAH box helicase [Desulfogranum mediterraneum]|uniref:DEAD/DEAH box helicase n=1 Tax=Desulfogranum mediterraneum TaxID=160661 RepID=UPI00042984C1|nr:DEAD/DEAH box helicase [Desulfogranum mediterraneum]